LGWRATFTIKQSSSPITAIFHLVSFIIESLTQMLKRSLYGLLILALLAVSGFGAFLYMQSHPSVAAIASTQRLNEIDAKLSADHLDARLYRTACASCHYNAASGFSRDRPNLADNDTIANDDPTELITVILRGKGSEMPAYANGLADSDVAMIAAYLRATRTKNTPWPDLEGKVAAARTKINASSGVTGP
jgi:mono/diheme cytochrome c family protein